MAERQGIYRVLAHASIYETVQRTMGAGQGRKRLADEIAAKPGDRVLDIGCGPGGILPYLPPVDYHGWEPNSKYVEAARRRFGHLGKFNVGYFGAAEADRISDVDVALVCAVLHHLSDQEVGDLLGNLKKSLKPSGRVVTVDAVFHQGQGVVSRVFAMMDRGKHVRSPEAYMELAAQVFGKVQGRVEQKSFPSYYSHWIMVAENCAPSPRP